MVFDFLIIEEANAWATPDDPVPVMLFNDLLSWSTLKGMYHVNVLLSL